MQSNPGLKIVTFVMALFALSLNHVAAESADQITKSQQSVKSNDFKVTLLGTGTPRSGPDRYGAAILVEADKSTFLFDAGRGVAIRIRQAKGGRRPFANIDNLFLTQIMWWESQTYG